MGSGFIRGSVFGSRVCVFRLCGFRFCSRFLALLLGFGLLGLAQSFLNFAVLQTHGVYDPFFGSDLGLWGLGALGLLGFGVLFRISGLKSQCGYLPTPPRPGRRTQILNPKPELISTQVYSVRGEQPGAPHLKSGSGVQCEGFHSGFRVWFWASDLGRF